MGYKKSEMKKIILRSAVTGLLSMLFLIACQSASDRSTVIKKENIADAEEDLTYSLNDSLAGVISDSLTLWERFKKESTERINDNKMRIASLKASIAGKADDVKADYQKNIAVLEAKNDELKRKLIEYKNDKKEDLETFKQKMNNDINDVARSLKNFKISL